MHRVDSSTPQAFAHQPTTPQDTPPQAPPTDTLEPPVAKTWTWGGAIGAVGAAISKFNPSGIALRHALVPGAYGYLPTDIYPGNDAQVRSFTTVLGGQVDMRAYPAAAPAVQHKVIVGFHGNGCSADSMDPMWQSYRAFGQVLAVNLPGYGHSSAPADGSELELHMAAAVQGVRDYLTEELHIEANNIVWYGLSLGGSAATIGFEMLPGSHVALHNTFTSVSAVAGNVLGKSLVGRLGPAIAAFASFSGLPRNVTRPKLNYTTDGLDNLGKLTACRKRGAHALAGSRVLVMAAGEDALMAATYPMALARGYFGDNVPASSVHIVAGATHNSSIENDVEAQKTLRTFLTAI